MPLKTNPVSRLHPSPLCFLLCATTALGAPPPGAYNRPQVSIIPAEVIPPSPALSAVDELKTFQLAPGIRVELVASEPMVEHPVAVQFDQDGRMWVVEMRGYMPNLEGIGEDQPVGRVSVLTDTDGDGRMDKSTVFLDGIVMPRAVLPVRNGALIGAPPHLWFCPDADGDGKADEKIEVARDFGAAIDPNNVAVGEPENKPNNPLWSYDNWIYFGHYTGKFRWNNGAWERGVIASCGQWGLSQDDWGHFFNNSNSAQLSAQIVPSHYLNRNPNHPRPQGRNTTVAREQWVWPARVTPGLNRAYVPEMLRDYKLMEFTSACAPWIYRGDLFPREFLGNAFVCEPAGNLIKRNIVASKAGTLTAREAYDKKEFIASTDERFRPVNLTTGPDGALYVCDMYHGIIQHRVSISKYLEDQVRSRGLDKPVRLGRIWRVVPAGSKRPEPPAMSKETPQQWVGHLSHPNAWWRETAQRLLVERGDTSVVSSLERLAGGVGEPMGRVHALWTLHGLHSLTGPSASHALGDPDPRVRAAAVRAGEALLGGKDRSELLAKWIALSKAEAEAEVQLQLALSLGEARTLEADLAVVALCRRAQGRPFLDEALFTGSVGRELEIIEQLLPEPPDQKLDALLGSLASCVLSSRDAARIQRLLDATAATPAGARARRIAVLNGVGKSVIVTPNRPARLGGEPAALGVLRTELSDSAKATLDKVEALLIWPGKPNAPVANAAPLTSAEQTRFDLGKTLYSATCAACHQPHGLGLEGVAPPLADSEWVTGSVGRLGRIAINGVRGPIRVGDRRFGLEMPALGVLNDEQLAAIFTYVRREWGHAASPVEADTVKQIRTTIADRQDAWTEAELLKLPAQ
jgi:mono/diheme cytochrome c family protein/glucose/arabinose dehydrogenase